ncbi:hypothetical protein KI659_16005 [Litoribacter alkaliphilus]|uniref:Uncharacterized protein n=1 Tax=Litoribacter ruber TaxID=702568 RepID=A0AAP2CLN0_9BACT|nr:hypothetical protein [Litoribacter alkaliphilus]MBS9525521.1 hypothetical protein [Litoribacter alkaliphilus]
MLNKCNPRYHDTPSEERSSREGHESKDGELPQPGQMAASQHLMLEYLVRGTWYLVPIRKYKIRSTRYNAVHSAATFG